MGQSNANISRDTYNEAKRNQMLVNQQGVPWVDADDNEQRWIFYNLLRRLTQGFIGNGALNDGFKIVGTGAANDFTITGGDGTAEGAGRLLVEGFQCVLPASRNYKGSGNLECTPVSTGLTAAVLTDSAANFTLGGANNNLAGRILVPDITQPGKTYIITGNTQTTITVSGNMLNDGIQSAKHYRVELSTPLSARTDDVYIDCYLDEIDGEEDPQIKHTLGMEIETQRRLKLIQNVLVAEGGPTPANYTDSDGNRHYTLKLATIQRYAGQSAINPGNVTDARVSIDTTVLDIISEIMSARGVESSLNARLSAGNGSLVDADKLDGQEGADYLARSNHSGVQPPASISPQGAGSDLDADSLDGQQGAYYQARSSHIGVQDSSTISPQGAGSGLDADKLDGRHADEFIYIAENEITSFRLLSFPADNVYGNLWDIASYVPAGYRYAVVCVEMQQGRPDGANNTQVWFRPQGSSGGGQLVGANRSASGADETGGANQSIVSIGPNRQIDYKIVILPDAEAIFTFRLQGYIR